MFKYLAAFTLLIASVSFANAQSSGNICNTDFNEVDRKLTEDFGEKHIFSGLTITGVPIHFYVNNKTWTVIIETPQGFCTGPAYSGKTIINNTVEERHVRR